MMAGRVAPLFAAGEWELEVHALAKRQSAELLGDTVDLTAEARSQIALTDLDRVQHRADVYHDIAMC